MKRAKSKPRTKMPEPVSDKFVQGYLQEILDSTTGERDLPLSDLGYSINDFADEALKTTIEECNEFLKENSDNVNATGYEDDELGAMFWKTRQRIDTDNDFAHRGWRDIGNELTAAARKFKSLWPNDAPDGKIYLERVGK